MTNHGDDPNAADASTPVSRSDADTIPATAADDAATRVTKLATGDVMPTQANVAATLPATSPGDPDQTRLSTGNYDANTAGPNTAAIARVTAGFTRTIRTRVNLHLPAEAQQLDQKLQSSRTSVLADLVATARHTIPKGLQSHIETRDTEARYAVDRPLAAGGMGAVLQISDHDFQRTAAMKVIHGKYANHPDVVERFLAEAQVTAQLEHPNIVPIHDMGAMNDGTLFFTMKLIEGDSLGKVVKLLKAEDSDALTRWTLEEKIIVFLKVLDGVGFANSHGVIHRDIKPDNIMLGAHGEVLVVDWGIAKVLGKADRSSDLVRKVETVRQQNDLSNTMEGSAMGTIYYMPPEQARGELESIGPWSDVYALGATLYELLTLKRPVETGDLQSMVARVSTGEIIPISRAAPDLPIDLVAIIEKSMQATIDLRYPDCGTFAADLRRFLSGQAVAARRRNLLERIGAWYGRHRLVVQGSTAAIALLILASVTTTWYLRTQTARAVSERVASAETLFAAGDSASLNEAKDLLIEAKGLHAQDPRVISLLTIVQQRLEDVTQREELERIKHADAGRAAALLGQALEHKASGDLTGARELLDAARRLAPADEAIDRERRTVLGLLEDSEKQIRVEAAQAAKTKGDEMLAQAQSLSRTDPAVADLLSQAEAAFTLSGKDGIAALGITASVETLANLRKDVATANAAETARTEGEALLTKAKAAFTQGDLTTARDTAAASVDRLAGRRDAAELLAQIVARQREEAARLEQVAARSEAERQAAARLAVARGEVAHISAAKRDLDAALLRRTQAGADRQALVTAQSAQREATRAIAEHWQLAEAAAQNAVALLQDDRGAETVIAARALLADLYVGRLQSARAEGRLPEIAAFTNLLARFDDGRYQAESAGRCALTVSGTVGTSLTITALRMADDGRIVPATASQTLSLPSQAVDLSSGRWRFDDGKTQWDLLLVAGAQTITWPTPTSFPALAPRCAPLPAHGDNPAYLLSTTEITHEQYLAFVSDPKILKSVLPAYERMRSQVDAGQIPTDPLPLVPRLLVAEREQWETVLKGSRVIGFTIPPALRGRAVSGISRDDAEAYCTWLGQQIGRTVRLPSAEEWRFAADGGDPQRVFPWGDSYDPSFCVTAFDTEPNDLIAHSPGTKPSDRGPFGHLDLAGNVHEWLSDRRGRIGGLVAGGSISADQADDFTCAATTSAEPGGVYVPIGFRILVEIPQ